MSDSQIGLKSNIWLSYHHSSEVLVDKQQQKVAPQH